jgi:hypothetical protein
MEQDLRIALIMLAAALVPSACFGGDGETAALYKEPKNSGWALIAENDSFISPYRDEDYTSGGAITLAGARVSKWIVSLDPFLRWTDRHIGVEGLYKKKAHFQVHDLQFGYMLFTPNDLEATEPIDDDRPYASLFYLSNTRETVLPETRVAYTTRLMFGLIGLDLAETLQEGVHESFGKRDIGGWDNQISSGGEVTAGYSVAVQKALADTRHNQLKVEAEGDIGFFTGGRGSLSWRGGRINSPWWSFNPQQGFYTVNGAPVAPRTPRGVPKELYLWAGLRAEYVLYTVLLQGQFRESAHTFSRDQIEPIVLEGWLGGTWEIGWGFRASFAYRYRTKDFDADQAGPVEWGSIVLSQSF